MAIEQYSCIFQIDDVYHDPKCQFTVVTGVVRKGDLKKGDHMVLLSVSDRYDVVCRGVEMGGRITNYGKEGDQVGIMIDYLTKDIRYVGGYLVVYQPTCSDLSLSDFDFIFRIESVIRKRTYMVMSGTVLQGRIDVNSEVSFVGDTVTNHIMLTGIESTGVIAVSAFKGQNVVLLTDGVVQNIHVGDYVAKFRNGTKVEEEPKAEQIRINMREQNGVYHVPCAINGVETLAVFDTGAAKISMTDSLYKTFRKYGCISPNDEIGEQWFEVADGKSYKGKVINLRTVVIGNRTLYDVHAGVIPGGDSEMLLGQSALSRFGKVTLDYNNQTIIFE